MTDYVVYNKEGRVMKESSALCLSAIRYYVKHNPLSHSVSMYWRQYNVDHTIAVFDIIEAFSKHHAFLAQEKYSEDAISSCYVPFLVDDINGNIHTIAGIFRLFREAPMTYQAYCSHREKGLSVLSSWVLAHMITDVSSNNLRSRHLGYTFIGSTDQRSINISEREALHTCRLGVSLTSLFPLTNRKSLSDKRDHPIPTFREAYRREMPIVVCHDPLYYSTRSLHNLSSTSKAWNKKVNRYLASLMNSPYTSQRDTHLRELGALIDTAIEQLGAYERKLTMRNKNL